VESVAGGERPLSLLRAWWRAPGTVLAVLVQGLTRSRRGTDALVLWRSRRGTDALVLWRSRQAMRLASVVVGQRRRREMRLAAAAAAAVSVVVVGRHRPPEMPWDAGYLATGTTARTPLTPRSSSIILA
jgi:hypothetical protein